MAVATSKFANLHSGTGTSLHSRLNSEWHKRSLQLFMFIVLAHWAEHLVQAVQIYVLGWPRPQAGGVLGLWFPFLVSSEVLHYGYAIVMLVGLWMLRKGFTGTSRKWWTVALVIQFWHHIEHLLLQAQAILQYNLLGSPVPLSFLQMAFPKNRVEIHLFYNAIVFIPMIIGMYYHMFPSSEEAPATCTCALHRQPIAA
jgi:putative Mn2+ efflux pump MntP